MTALEDTFADVLGKAMAGLGMGQDEAAEKSGLPSDAIRALLRGEFEEKATRQLSDTLGLRADALARLGRGEYHPAVTPAANLAQIATRFGEMSVNAYVLWDPESRGAAIFDTGADAAPILDLVERENLEVAGIFLTHSHADHIQALGALQNALAADAWSSEYEPVRRTRTFRPGDLFNAGRHFIRTRNTPGHSPGGATFVIEGRLLSAAIVGDALFAGSVGGVRSGYREALETIRREVLTLSAGTIVCPGHGPMSTVGQERENNPFF
jgi:glyoxylase-like metal-dependent hydrolase (beta-lactamase superfamily II)